MTSSLRRWLDGASTGRTNGVGYLWGDIMGVRSIKICERNALELSCDGVAHGTQWRSAWFDSGTDFGNFALATAAGWSEWRAKQAWLCPQCARKNALESAYSNARTHIDEFVAEEEVQVELSTEAAKKLKSQVKAPLVTPHIRVSALEG